MNKIAIGIDVGISTTKIVGIRDGEVVSPLWIKATDPVTSLYGAFGKFLHDNDIALDDVERVMLTGVGAAYINSPIYGLTTQKVEEFIADGLGAAFESKLNRMIVVSMGTGTSLVSTRTVPYATLAASASAAVPSTASAVCYSKPTTSSRSRRWLSTATSRTST